MRPECRAAGLHRLDWDSRNFRLAVAQVVDPRLDDPALAALLRCAREDGVDLVYWPARKGRSAGAPVLTAFHGRVVDIKTTYVRDLSLADLVVVSRGVRVEEYPRGPADPALLELGIGSGEQSRYRVDPDFPRKAFEFLYRTWTNLSTRREMAATVLVARFAGVETAGMVTVTQDGERAGIGLIAVSPECRGRGIGALLVVAAHGWMRDHGAKSVTVVTQETNKSACLLYEKMGYSLAHVRTFHHFWPQKGQGEY